MCASYHRDGLCSSVNNTTANPVCLHLFGIPTPQPPQSDVRTHHIMIKMRTEISTTRLQ